MNVSDNDFVLRVCCGVAEAADTRQSAAVHRSIKKRPHFPAETVEAGLSLQLAPEHDEHGAGVRGGHLLLRGRTLGLLPGTSKEYTSQLEARRPQARAGLAAGPGSSRRSW